MLWGHSVATVESIALSASAGELSPGSVGRSSVLALLIGLLLSQLVI